MSFITNLNQANKIIYLQRTVSIWYSVNKNPDHTVEPQGENIDIIFWQKNMWFFQEWWHICAAGKA